MPGFNIENYEPVETRLARFWAEHPHGRVLTTLVEHTEGQWVFRTDLYREGDTEPFAVGHAHEIESQRGVNATSAAENCETSSTGRALANAGYAPKGARPSREETQRVSRREPASAERRAAVVEMVKVAGLGDHVKANFKWPWTETDCDEIETLCEQAKPFEGS